MKRRGIKLWTCRYYLAAMFLFTLEICLSSWKESNNWIISTCRWVGQWATPPASAIGCLFIVVSKNCKGNMTCWPVQLRLGPSQLASLQRLEGKKSTEVCIKQSPITTPSAQILIVSQFSSEISIANFFFPEISVPD